MVTKVKAAEPKASTAAVIPPSGAETLMSLVQIGAALGVSKRKVEKMVASGEYPRHDMMVGDLKKWKVSTHNAWVASRCEGRA